MFYALPAIGSCVQSHSSNVENLQRSIQRNWTKLHKTGIVLDIFIIAGLAIVAALALCAHYNLPLGSFSNISAIELPYIALLGGTAIVLFLADLVKMVNRCRGSIKNTASGLGVPSSTTTVIPTNQDSTPPSTTITNVEQINTDDKSKWVDLPPFIKDDNPSSPKGSTTQFNLSTSFNIDQDAEQSSQFYTPIRIASLPEVQDVSTDDFVELDPTENRGNPPDTNNGGWFGGIVNAVTAVINTTRSTAQAIKEKATQMLTDWVKSFFPPGTIQMRFYTIQINFILDQLLTYNESTQEFEKIGLPIPFDAKLKLLEEKKFKESQMNAFKEKLIAIIKANRGHPFSTRYALLDEIEIAYKKLQDQTTHFQSFLQGLCYQLYTQFDGLTYGEDIVLGFLPSENITFNNLCTTLRNDYLNIAGLRQEHPELIGNQLRDDRNRMQGAAGVAFSPMMTSNFACKLWKENSIQIIRYGTPTSQAIHYGEILGQMKLFIKGCEDRKESLLSFQHQDKNSNENERLKPMFTLAEKHPTAFYCLGLDMDSKFYQQAREGIDFEWNAETKSYINKMITYEKFKKDLINHINSEKRCPKSQNLQERINNEEGYQDQLSALADVVWGNYFQEDDRLSVEERKDFIFLYYIYYRKYMHHLIKPTFSSHQCKDTMDRSMSLATAAFLVNAVEENQQNEPGISLKFRALVNFVGMIVKGSPMDPNRFERFISVIQRITLSKLQYKPYTCTQSIDLPSFGHKYLALPCDATSEASYKNMILVGSTNEWVHMATLTQPEQAPLFLEQIYRNNQLNYGIKIKDDTFHVYLKTEENVICQGQFEVDDDGNLFVIQGNCTVDQKID